MGNISEDMFRKMARVFFKVRRRTIFEAYHIGRSLKIVEGGEPHAVLEECVDLSQISGLPTQASDENSLAFACPHCGTQFPVPEDSEEYMVGCPGCGKQLDLTELTPL